MTLNQFMDVPRPFKRVSRMSDRECEDCGRTMTNGDAILYVTCPYCEEEGDGQ